MVTKHKNKHRESAGYTLLETLVIGSILSVLSAQLLPTVGLLRDKARRTSCGNNLKQIGVALHYYHETYKTFPHNGLFHWTRQSNNGYTWYNSRRGSPFVKLLPFLEQAPLYNQLNFEMAGPDKNQQFHLQKGISGKLVRSEVIPTFICPSAPIDPHLGQNPLSDPAISCHSPSVGAASMPARQHWCTDYPGNVFGTGRARHADDPRSSQLSGVFSRGHWGARFRDVTDGTAQVIAMGEILPHKSSNQRLGWMSFNANWTATTAPINHPNIGLGEAGYPGPRGCQHSGNWQTSNAFRSAHPGGAQFVFCDGSIHQISELIDYMTYQRLGDRRDGQPIGDGWRP